MGGAPIRRKSVEESEEGPTAGGLKRRAPMAGHLRDRRRGGRAATRGSSQGPERPKIQGLRSVSENIHKMLRARGQLALTRVVSLGTFNACLATLVPA